MSGEITEENHALMNKARIQQSLPKEYLEGLLKASELLQKIQDEQRRENEFQKFYLKENE